MAQLRGKTLWFSALALWLTASPASGRATEDSALGASAPVPAVEESHAATASELNLDEAE